MTITKEKLNVINKILENNDTIVSIRTKLNRWQKVIDNSEGNSIVQDARDEVMQECIDSIRAILDK